jgi:hypothetical protein
MEYEWKACALVALCALALSACGGGDSSKDKGVNTTVAGASGTTGTTTGATSGGAKPPRGTSGASGGASAPAKRTPRARKGGQPGSSQGGGRSPKRRQPSGGKKNPAAKNGGTVEQGPSAFYTGQQKELYREAKIICKSLTLEGLSKEYVVKKTPEAVARAYSATYPVNLRGAVYTGCKDGVSKPSGR